MAKPQRDRNHNHKFNNTYPSNISNSSNEPSVGDTIEPAVETTEIAELPLEECEDRVVEEIVSETPEVEEVVPAVEELKVESPLIKESVVPFVQEINEEPKEPSTAVPYELLVVHWAECKIRGISNKESERIPFRKDKQKQKDIYISFASEVCGKYSLPYAQAKDLTWYEYRLVH